MENEKQQELYGYATIDPSGEVAAGSSGTWKLTYVAGSKGLPPGGHIRINTDSDTDWGLPQIDDPSSLEYLTVHAPKGVRTAVLIGNVKTLLLTVNGKGLSPGEEAVLTYGDRSGGGPGTRAQTFVEGRRNFRVSVDPEGDGEFVTLEDSPYLTVVGGPPSRLVAIAPSGVIRGETFRLLVKAEDQWGNPSAPYRGTVEVRARGVEMPSSRHTFKQEESGVYSFESCVCNEAGLHRFTVTDTERGFSAMSNPILCIEKSERHTLYWGEAHGGQVAMAAKIPDFFRYARDVSALDFAGYQRNDHDMSNDDWKVQQQAEVEFLEPGRFVPLPGFEWSGDTEMGGDHNVYFQRHRQPLRRSSHSGVNDKSDVETDLPHITDLHNNYRYSDAVIIPHVGGRHADLAYHEPALEPAIEVTSTHGSFEWFLRDALRRGYKVGFMGGSDGYTGRPGGEYPGHQTRRYAKGGYTGLYAEALTLESLLEAVKARRCYATTGARILVRTSVDGHPMGTEYATESPPKASVFVAGTAPLESVELFRGLEPIYSHPPALSGSANRVRIIWQGASRKTSYSGVIWDGGLTITGGKIGTVEKLRFDSPRSYVSDTTGKGLRWHSVTCGYPSGVVVDLDGDDDSLLGIVLNTTLISGPRYGGYGFLGSMKISYSPAERLSFNIGLEELKAGPKEIDIGVLDRKLTISMAPEKDGEETAEFTFVDPSPGPGINPYWVRVVQSDLEMAWASPVFVDYTGR